MRTTFAFTNFFFLHCFYVNTMKCKYETKTKIQKDPDLSFRGIFIGLAVENVCLLCHLKI